MSKVGGLIIQAIAAPIARQIERGQPRYIALGALIGTGVGVGVGVAFTTYLLIPGIGLGAIVGALLGSLTRKPPSAPAEGIVSPLPVSSRGLVRGVFGHAGDVGSLTVLMDNAVCVYWEVPVDQWSERAAALGCQDVPDDVASAQGMLIRLEAIREIELDPSGGWGKFRFDDRGQIRRIEFRVGSPKEQEALVSGIEQCLGFDFAREERELGLGRSVAVPVIALVLILSATLGLARLAESFQHAPSPPGDASLAALVTLIGRKRLEWIGGSLALVPFCWALYRSNHRLRRTVLTPTRLVARASGWRTTFT